MRRLPLNPHVFKNNFIPIKMVFSFFVFPKCILNHANISHLLHTIDFIYYLQEFLSFYENSDYYTFE